MRAVQLKSLSRNDSVCTKDSRIKWLQMCYPLIELRINPPRLPGPVQRGVPRTGTPQVGIHVLSMSHGQVVAVFAQHSDQRLVRAYPG